MVRPNKRGLGHMTKAPTLKIIKVAKSFHYFVTFFPPILNNLNRIGPHFPLDMPGKGPLSHKPPSNSYKVWKILQTGSRAEPQLAVISTTVNCFWGVPSAVTLPSRIYLPSKSDGINPCFNMKQQN